MKLEHQFFFGGGECSYICGLGTFPNECYFLPAEE